MTSRSEGHGIKDFVTTLNQNLQSNTYVIRAGNLRCNYCTVLNKKYQFDSKAVFNLDKGGQSRLLRTVIAAI